MLGDRCMAALASRALGLNAAGSHTQLISVTSQIGCKAHHSERYADKHGDKIKWVTHKERPGSVGIDHLKMMLCADLIRPPHTAA